MDVTKNKEENSEEEEVSNTTKKEIDFSGKVKPGKTENNFQRKPILRREKETKKINKIVHALFAMKKDTLPTNVLTEEKCKTQN